VTEAWDLVVVGAGPAGACAALGALHDDPSLRVLLLDREDFPRDKSCGDGIAPHVFDALAEVGVHDVADGWKPLHRLDLSHGSSTVAGRLSRPVWVIPRAVFDAHLVRHAVAAGAVLRRHRVRAIAEDADGVTVDGELRARVVVGADGAYSALRTLLRRPTTHRRAIAIRGYSPTPPERAGTQAIVYGDRRHPSYAWAFDRGDGLANVGYGEFVVDRDDRPTRTLMMSELERLIPGSTEGGTDWRAHHLPLSGWRPEPSGARVLLAGDAAHLVNPMTGEGIFYAVATGLAAGRAAASRPLVGQSVGGHYDRAVRRLLGTHLHHTWAAARLSRSPTVLDAGIRAARRDQAAFDALVELGLGDGRITPRLAGGLARGLVTRS
jgi:menaquinone-9 beta-reductase